MSNTLAYNTAAFITTVKSFIVQTPGWYKYPINWSDAGIEKCPLNHLGPKKIRAGQTAMSPNRVEKLK